MFCLVLGSILHEKSVVFHSKSLSSIYGALIFFNSVLKPVKWSYPLIPLISVQNYSLMKSPFPILGGVHDDVVFVLNHYTSPQDRHLLHVDLDKNYHSGIEIFKLEKLFKGSKVFEKLKSNYEKIQKTLYKESFIELSNPDNLYVIETLILIRSLLNDIFMFDDKGLKAAKNKKEYVLSKSKLDKSAHTQLISGQMF